MKFLEELAARRRFGMRPGLDAIRGVCAALGVPQRDVPAIHVAGTNGKGAVCAILDAALRANGKWKTENGKLRASAAGGGKRVLRIGRYTSPHLVRLNERFFLDGRPVDDATLESAAARVSDAIHSPFPVPQLTFFEALTAVAFLVYREAKVDYAILETGLGGRLDATNVCVPRLCVLTRIGLDHCDWLGDTVEKIAAEKAGILKPGVPVVLGANIPEVRAVVEARAKEVGAPFHYAPDLAGEDEIPPGFSLAGKFNRENAVTAIAALKVLGFSASDLSMGFSKVVWPGRFQAVGGFVVDGAHNPPAARALVESLRGLWDGARFDLIAGFCGDKDVSEVLSALSPLVKRGYAVRTNNPRSLSSAETAARMRGAGIDAVECPSLRSAIDACGGRGAGGAGRPGAIVCGSLFLAGEALVELGAYPWPSDRFDASELLRQGSDMV